MKTQILAIGRNEEILQTVIRLINNNKEWNGIAATTDENAIELFRQNQFEIVLLGGGIDQESEKKLLTIFNTLRKETIIIQHYGGGSGLLANEIQQALCSKKSITDG